MTPWTTGISVYLVHLLSCALLEWVPCTLLTTSQGGTAITSVFLNMAWTRSSYYNDGYTSKDREFPLYKLCLKSPSTLLIFQIGWMVGMLLVSRFRLVEEDAVEVFHYNGIYLSSSFLMYNFKSFQGK